MNDAISLDEIERRERSIASAVDLRIVQASTWEGRTVSPPLWAVADRIPLFNVTLLSGEGAVGKSLLMAQLMVSTTLGHDWLGVLPETGPVIALNAEEDEDEFHRRLVRIVAHYGARLADLRDLYALCLAGQDAVLAAPDHDGIVRPTPLFEKLKAFAVQVRPRLITIDNAADVFAGKENDRTQVRQFITLLRGLAIEAGAAVLLSSHPSLTGISTGTGLSGSTAWHNSVRARLVMKSVADADATDSDVRVLEMRKSNYGPIVEKLTLKWSDGLFLPVGSGGTDWLTKRANEARVDELFITLLARFNANGQSVSNKTGTTYAPATFARHDMAEGVKGEAFAKSMQRLLDAGRIRIETSGPPSRQRTRLIGGASQ
jgi:RecA-family ATPase